MPTTMPTITAPGASARNWFAVTGSALLLAASLLALPAHAQDTPVPTVQLPDFTVLAERVSPAVVNIRTVERRAAASAGGTPGMTPDIEEFFRRFGIPMPGRPGPRGGPPGSDDEPRQRGVGSGFILSPDGFVMTNAHVVEGADEVLVTLPDRREFKARIVGSDRRTDVAVVKIEAADLPTVRIGDVSRLRVGEWVLAIGSPFGLENTVTAGIVSAKQRDTGDYLPFIQTDVAINPGNSGGPLLNMRGEVVGINSMIYSRSGGFMGISFAIPIDEAMNVADQLRTQGRVIRGRIGVQIAPVTKEVAEAIGLGEAKGALVRSVEAGGPAAAGGIEAGDIIVRVDGRDVERSVDLPRIVGGTRPGTRSTITVFRRGERKDLRVTVAEFPADTPVASAGSPAPRSAPPAVTALGLGVVDLTDAEKKELDVRGGVRVQSVEGAAARAGLQVGDVILQVGNAEVGNARRFQELAGRAAQEGRTVGLLVRRGEWVNFVLVRP